MAKPAQAAALEALREELSAATATIWANERREADEACARQFQEASMNQVAQLPYICKHTLIHLYLCFPLCYPFVSVRICAYPCISVVYPHAIRTPSGSCIGSTASGARAHTSVSPRGSDGRGRGAHGAFPPPPPLVSVVSVPSRRLSVRIRSYL